MPIVIRKKVTLDFLDGHADDYLEFKAIPLKDFTDFQERIEKAQENNAESIKLVLTLLETYFIGGKFDGTDVIKEDLSDLDQETAIKCFEKLTGQADPKSEGQSPTPSSTELPPQ